MFPNVAGYIVVGVLFLCAADVLTQALTSVLDFSMLGDLGKYVDSPVWLILLV
jgi:hypothetical protein